VISSWRSGAGKLSHPGNSPLAGWAVRAAGSLRFVGVATGFIGSDCPSIVLTSTGLLPLPEVAHEGNEITEADEAER
jgi:hypothetical protein